MRGYFGVGVEGISKPFNVGNLFRTAHAFGASFAFTINANYKAEKAISDTAKSYEHMPLYAWAKVEDISLPEAAQIVGVEITDDAIDLPSFRHPLNAVYVFGPERGILSDKLQSQCAYIVRIPTKFSINVGTAGAIVLYDRLISIGRFENRPVRSGGPV